MWDLTRIEKPENKCLPIVVIVSRKGLLRLEYRQFIREVDDVFMMNCASHAVRILKAPAM